MLLGIGLLLAAITSAAHLYSSPLPILPPLHEEFDPDLRDLDSVDAIMLWLDRAHPNASPLQKLDAADALLRRRFFHSFSYYRFDQNWVAASLRPIWDDLASPVRPDDILRFRRAACSQQSIVFLEIARRLGFDYAAVAAPGHFMAAVEIDGSWWVYDANQEVKARRYPFAWLKTADLRIADIYRPHVAKLLLDGARDGRNSLVSVNQFSAPQAALLHAVAEWLSRFGWLAVLGFWAMLKLAAAPAQPRAGMRYAQA